MYIIRYLLQNAFFFKDSVVAAEKYIENKRPVLPVKYDKEDYNKVRVTFDGTPLEHIDLSSDLESEDEAPEEMVRLRRLRCLMY